MSYKKVKAFFMASALALCLSACGQAGDEGEAASSSEAAADPIDTSDMFTDRDLSGEYDSSATTISLSDDGSTCDSADVTIAENTITITKEGTYLLSGSLSDGQIVVDADGDKVQLVLDGASVTNSTSAAIYVQKADKVFVTLADGSDNTLATTGEFVAIDDNNIDAAIFSKSDLTLNGNGSLTIDCASGHGVVSKDDLCITAGTYTVTASSHALCGKDSVRIAGGTFALTAGKDGIHSENSDDTEKGFIYIADGSFTIECTSDGIDASATAQIDGGSFAIAAGDDGVHSDSDLIIYNGDIDITKSYEGLEGMTITIYDGDISIMASDDGLNAAGGNDSSGFGGFGGGMDYSASNQIILNGGTLYVNASGDGIDSNGDFTMNGGTVTVDGPTNDGDAPLDWGGSGIVNGGTLIAVGSSGMAEGFDSSCTQGVMLVTLSSNQSGDASLSDADSNTLLTHTAAKSYNCVIFSSSDISEGATYTVTAGSETATIEMTSLVYGSGGMGGGNMGGGMGGGFDGGKGGSFGGGQQPDGTEMPEMPDGTEMPSMPDGTGMPSMPDGTEMPSMPDGTEMPSMPDGTEMPSMPDGTEMPEMPDGGFDGNGGGFGGGQTS